jgi:cell fate regulator YaaT (PSP1 superfamily)
MEPFIVGVRFQKVGKVYHFDAVAWQDLKPGDFAVVETSRGRQLGQVVQVLKEAQPPPEGTWKPILRRATPQDLVLRQSWQQKELEATINTRAKAAEMGVEGVKIVASEFSFDGARLSLLYSSEGDEKIDLRNLRRAMQRIYPHTQVEMHQIGPRDVAKILGGMGACGLENRCCSKFLTEFSPISIKMAKEQGISLTPTEITGMCGRLRCCLVYEYEQYVEARKQLPKRGKRVVTPLGEGKVADIYPLKEAVIVELETGVSHEFMKHEIQPFDELEALKQKSQAPCDRHLGGGCDCGRAGQPVAEKQAAPSTEEPPRKKEEFRPVRANQPEKKKRQ